MKIQFSKYQGTGNDFVILQNITQEGHNKISPHDVRRICARHTGVGADGLIILQNKEGVDFHMDYFNSDGMPSTMCGNGGRCAVAFANRIGVIQDTANFTAIDGAHSATFNNDIVSLVMQNVTQIDSHETFFQLNTGSPHYVTIVDNVNDINVNQEGALIRNSPLFEAEGINVNFAEEITTNELFVRTYERGVEAETLSCGTGVTAASLVQMMLKNINQVSVKTLGGDLSVEADRNGNHFENVRLTGPATFVFDGEISIDA